MKITKSDFGTTNTGENINIYHLENEAGAYVEILNFGCRLVKIVVPDRNGNPTDVCLGMDTMSAYENDDASLGAVVGRVANRIKDGMAVGSLDEAHGLIEAYQEEELKHT